MTNPLKSKPGVTSASTLSIPKDWDPAWFRSFISGQLKGADVRNAIAGAGITISGNISSPYATISATGAGLISSVVGTANEIAVSTAGGVATISITSPLVTPGNIIDSGALQVLGTSATGFAAAAGAEIQLAGGTAYFQGFNRGTSSYIPVNIFGSSLSIGIGGVAGFMTMDGSGHVAFSAPSAAGSTVSASIFAAANTAAFNAQASSSLGAAFYDANVLHATLVMDSVGANYGTIGNINTQVWGLGSSNTIGPMSSGGTIALQWGATGGVTIPAPTISTPALIVVGAAGDYAAQFNGAASTGNSYGPLIEAGTNSSDDAFLVYNQAVSTLFFQIRGDGLMSMNCAGLTISNVSGNASIPLVVNAPAGNWGIELLGGATANTSYGLLIEAGTSQSDYAMYVGNHGNTSQLFQVFGDGSVCVNVPGGPKGIGTINVSGGYYVNGVLIGSGSSGSFTGTLTGCTTSPTETMYYAIAGNVCTISLPIALTGTSNVTTLTITGLPAACEPGHAVGGVATVESSGVWNQGQWSIAASGTTITFAAVQGTSSGGFVASGAKGVYVMTFSYPLN